MMCAWSCIVFWQLHQSICTTVDLINQLDVVKKERRELMKSSRKWEDKCKKLEEKITKLEKALSKRRSQGSAEAKSVEGRVLSAERLHQEEKDRSNVKCLHAIVTNILVLCNDVITQSLQIEMDVLRLELEDCKAKINLTKFITKELSPTGSQVNSCPILKIESLKVDFLQKSLASPMADTPETPTASSSSFPSSSAGSAVSQQPPCSEEQYYCYQQQQEQQQQQQRQQQQLQAEVQRAARSEEQYYHHQQQQQQQQQQMGVARSAEHQYQHHQANVAVSHPAKQYQRQLQGMEDPTGDHIRPRTRNNSNPASVDAARAGTGSERGSSFASTASSDVVQTPQATLPPPPPAAAVAVVETLADNTAEREKKKIAAAAANCQQEFRLPPTGSQVNPCLLLPLTWLLRLEFIE